RLLQRALQMITRGDGQSAVGANRDSTARTERAANRLDHPATERCQDAVLALVHGDWSDPFGILGLHNDGPGGDATYRLFLPDARGFDLMAAAWGAACAAPVFLPPAGFWACLSPRAGAVVNSRFRAAMRAGLFEFEATSRFPPILGELDVHLLAEGQ